jgi:hypothetical protein
MEDGQPLSLLDFSGFRTRKWKPSLLDKARNRIQEKKVSLLMPSNANAAVDKSAVDKS